jgi:hypothetical protein
LNLALELDRRIYRGATVTAALKELRSLHRIENPILEALQAYRPAQAALDVRRLAIRELRSGMILDEDVLTNEGNMVILKKDTILTDTWIERLENFSKSRGTQPLLGVRVPMRFGPIQLGATTIEGSRG